MRFTSLSHWLSWLESQPTNASAEETFAQVKVVATRLNLLPYHYPVITVTGTNGKGSCVALLKSIYMASGYRVGTFISPHLIKFNERICLQNEMIEDHDLLRLFDQIDRARGEISLTYFQFALLAALLWFKEQTLDMVILEVGIGGRLDPTNIVDADMAILSSIALDHCDKLGETREQIGFEKAGIFRSDQLVICGDPNPPTRLLQQAEQLHVSLYEQGKDFFYEENDTDWRWHCQGKSIDALPKTSLMLINTSTALMAVHAYAEKFPVRYDALCEGVRRANLPWRCQVMQYEGMTFVLDVAHNPAATQHLFQVVSQLSYSGRLLALSGMSADKDLAGNVAPFLSWVDRWYLAVMQHSRSASLEMLTRVLPGNVLTFDSVASALKALLQEAKPGDLLILFGSCFLVNEVVALVPNLFKS